MWHRPPGGRWSIFADAPRLDIACPRYYAPACERSALAHIDVQWTGPATVQITMDSPALSWTVNASDTPLLRVMNRVSPKLPLWTWKPSALLAPRELMAHRLFGVGAIKMRGTTPSGHNGTFMPKRMYFIESSSAVFDGEDLGRPAHLSEQPDIGGVSVPSRGVLAIGQAAWEILDHEEYERTRGETDLSRSTVSLKRSAW